jgi:hypothetical protein
MRYLTKRIGLILFAVLSILEGFLNLAFYVSHLDVILPPVDIALPFHFWYTDTFLKTFFIDNLKETNHGKNL